MADLEWKKKAIPLDDPAQPAWKSQAIPLDDAQPAPAATPAQPVAVATPDMSDPRVASVMEMAAKAEAAGNTALAERFRASALNGVSPAGPSSPALQNADGSQTISLGPGGQMSYVDQNAGYSTTDEDFIMRLISGVSPEAAMQAQQEDARIAAAQNVPGPLRAVANFGRGVGKGLMSLYGLPADLISAAPTLPNILPGDQGFRSMTQQIADGDLQQVDGFWDGVGDTLMAPFAGIVNPVQDPQDPNRVVPAYGSAVFQDTGTFLADQAGIADSPAFTPVSMADRFAGRIGEEVGFSGPALARAIGSIAKSAPGIAQSIASKLVGREAVLAAGAGAGAQAANEFFTPEGAAPGTGTPMSDFVGSLVGGLGVPAATGAARTIRDLAGGVFGTKGYLARTADDAMLKSVLSNSTDMKDYAAAGGDPTRFDTSGMVDRLGTETSLEQNIPGYAATSGERLGDTKLKTFEQNLEGKVPGDQLARLENNAGAISKFMETAMRVGNPAEFRAMLDRGIDSAKTAASSAVDSAKGVYDQLMAKLAVSPDAALPSVRGATLRQGLQDVYGAGKQKVSDLFNQITEMGGQVDLAPLKAKFDEVVGGMELPDKRRFTPEAVTDLEQMIEAGPTANVGAITSLRSGLSSDILASMEPQFRKVAGQFPEVIDDFLEQVLPPEQLALYQEARALRSDLGKRFEEPDNVGRVMAETTRGGDKVPDEAVPGMLVPESDAGRVTDYGKMMKEVGTNPTARKAVEDTVKTRALQFANDPMRLAGYIENNKIVLSDFPQLKSDLEAAGASKAALDAAQKASDNVAKTLSPGGASPEGQYTRFGAEDPARSMATVLTGSDRPDEAMKALLDRAGRTPEAVNGAKTAFWEFVRGKGTNRATNQGTEVWNAANTSRMLHDPKFEAAAKELWGENYADFEALRGIIDDLEANTPGRLRAAGSSGTAQILNVRGGASLTPARVSADIRAVGQGRASGPLVGINWITDKLRSRTAEKQREWIDNLTREMINNPGAMADLLKRLNPAVDGTVKSTRVSQLLGVRGNPLGKLFAELAAGDAPQDSESEMNDAIWEKN